MLKFFRTIRKKVMEQNHRLIEQINRYLKEL